MSIFDKKQSFSRGELKNISSRDSGSIPRAGGSKFYQRDREKLVKESFSPKYGSQISKGDFHGVLNDLRRNQSQAKTRAEKDNIGKKINYLRKIGGI